MLCDFDRIVFMDQLTILMQELDVQPLDFGHFPFWRQQRGSRTYFLTLKAEALHLVDRTSEALIPGQRLEQAGRLELVRIVNDRPPSRFVLIRNFNHFDNGPDPVRYMSPNGPPSLFRVIGILTK
jgi:hypothetical protein